MTPRRVAAPAVPRWLVGACALLLAALTGLGGAAPASASSSSTSSSGASADAAPSGSRVGLAVTDSGSGVLRAGEPLRLGLQVTGLSAEDLARARVLVVAGTGRLTDSAALQRWADGKGASRGDLLLADVPLADLVGGAAGGAGGGAAGGAAGGGAGGGTGAGAPPQDPRDLAVEVVAQPELLARLGGSWGPRGLTVEVVDASGDRLAAQRTFVTWLPSAWTPTSRTDLTVLVPFSAGPPDVSSAVVPAERLAELVAPGGRLRRVLAVASQAGASWQVDPAALGEPLLPAATGDGATSGTASPSTDDAGGSGGPGSPSTQWVQDLAARAPEHDVSVLPWGDPDPVVLADAGAQQLLDLAGTRGAEVAASLPGATSALTRTGAPTMTSGAVEAAQDAGRRVAVTTQAAGSASDDASGTATGALARTDLRARAASGGSVPSVRAVSVSGPATRVLVAGTEVDDPQRPTTAATTARLVAESAALARAAPRGTDAELLLAPPAGWDVDPSAAEPVLAAVTASPWVTPTSLTALAGQPAATTARAPAGASDFSGRLPRAGVADVVAALGRARAGSAVLSAPGPYLGAARASAVSALSSAWSADPGGWRAGVDELSTSASAIDRAVRVVPGSAVTVLSARVDLPVTVVNDFDRAVDVTVSLDSSSPRLQPGGAEPITALGPGDRQRVLVPVRAVASGDVTAQVVLRADDGSRIGTPVELRVRVRADWESRGTAVVAAVVALVLLVGVVRTVRRNRGRGRTVPPGEPDAPDAPGRDGAVTPRSRAGATPTDDRSVSSGRGPS